MPATSKHQQRAMCMALAARKGDLEVSKLKGAALDIYKSDMTNKQIEDFTVLKEMKSLSTFLHESILSSNGAGIIFIIDENRQKFIDDIKSGRYSEKDVKRFNTSKLTAMNSLFSFCESISNLDLSRLDTSKVTDMRCTFWGCRCSHINLSNWDTSKVENMGSMFYNCRVLQEIDLSHFDTHNVKKMSGMFWGCSSLKELDLSHFNTSKVKDMNSMFQNCKNLEELDLSNWNMKNVKNTTDMFADCVSLKTIIMKSCDEKTVYMITSRLKVDNIKAEIIR